MATLHLEEEVLLDIPARNLEIGQLAVVTACTESRFIGKIVMIPPCTRGTLVVVGGESGWSWSNFRNSSEALFRVRVLQSGERLIVQ